MDWIVNLFTGSGVAHSIMLLAVTIGLGCLLGKIKIAGISLGITWILFVGIALSHFGMRINPEVLDFAKEFGLILFVYSIGLQVGPGFFSSFRKGGLRMNLMATSIVLLGAVTAYVIHLVSHTELSTMVGVMSGAITNTPSLGAAQQSFTEITGADGSQLTTGYAVAYPFGVLTIIFTTLALRGITRLHHYENSGTATTQSQTELVSIQVLHGQINGHQISDLHAMNNSPFVVSHIKDHNGTIILATHHSVIHVGDVLRIVTPKDNVEQLERLIGNLVETSDLEWETPSNNMVSRRLVVTQNNINGKTIGQLHIRSLYGVNVTRVYRSGFELVATSNLSLQIGDRLTVVGTEESINKLGTYLGNSLKRLDIPNLIPIFLGIFLGIVLGSLPIKFPGLPQPVKLGLAGGPLIVAILLARYGPYYKVITFTTTSANMMLREIGISLFLAAVGIGAGDGFIATITDGGYWWILYSILIACIPLLIVGCIALLIYKMPFYTVAGMMAGSTTDPPALAYANSMSSDDSPSVAYATVYPLTMFLRVLVAQIMIFLC